MIPYRLNILVHLNLLVHLQVQILAPTCFVLHADRQFYTYEYLFDDADVYKIHSVKFDPRCSPTSGSHHQNRWGFDPTPLSSLGPGSADTFGR